MKGEKPDTIGNLKRSLSQVKQSLREIESEINRIELKISETVFPSSDGLSELKKLIYSAEAFAAGRSQDQILNTFMTEVSEFVSRGILLLSDGDRFVARMSFGAFGTPKLTVDISRQQGPISEAVNEKCVVFVDEPGAGLFPWLKNSEPLPNYAVVIPFVFQDAIPLVFYGDSEEAISVESIEILVKLVGLVLQNHFLSYQAAKGAEFSRNRWPVLETFPIPGTSPAEAVDEEPPVEQPPDSIDENVAAEESLSEESIGPETEFQEPETPREELPEEDGAEEPAEESSEYEESVDTEEEFVPLEEFGDVEESAGVDEKVEVGEPSAVLETAESELKYDNDFIPPESLADFDSFEEEFRFPEADEVGELEVQIETTFEEEQAEKVESVEPVETAESKENQEDNQLGDSEAGEEQPAYSEESATSPENAWEESREDFQEFGEAVTEQEPREPSEWEEQPQVQDERYDSALEEEQGPELIAEEIPKGYGFGPETVEENGQASEDDFEPSEEIEKEASGMEPVEVESGINADTDFQEEMSGEERDLLEEEEVKEFEPEVEQADQVEDFEVLEPIDVQSAEDQMGPGLEDEAERAGTQAEKAEDLETVEEAELDEKPEGEEEGPFRTPEEEQMHSEAHRFARLLVAEIKLYNEDEVIEGRESRQIYQKLQKDIDRSREMYEKRVNPIVKTEIDYFHSELIRVLARNNAEVMGTDYPGPLCSPVNVDVDEA